MIFLSHHPWHNSWIDTAGRFDMIYHHSDTYMCRTVAYRAEKMRSVRSMTKTTQISWRTRENRSIGMAAVMIISHDRYLHWTVKVRWNLKEARRQPRFARQQAKHVHAGKITWFNSRTKPKSIFDATAAAAIRLVQITINIGFFKL